MQLTDLETIQYIAKKHKIHPSKAYGQHFLIDQDVLDEMVRIADIRSKENIVEIGPGLGVLTQELVAKQANVVAIEKDPALIHHLETVFGKDITLVHEDVLRITNEAIPTYFNKKEEVSANRYRIIANIPYSITGALLKKYISNTTPKPTEMMVLVQKEVAERVCAEPGNMSLLSLSVQLYGDPSYLFTVPSESFWPAPKVDSAVLYIKYIQEKPRYTIADIDTFWRIARIGFSSPRKQIHNNLVAGLSKENRDAIEQALAVVGISPRARAQELSVEDWVKLTHELA